MHTCIDYFLYRVFQGCSDKSLEEICLTKNEKSSREHVLGSPDKPLK